LLIFTTTVFRCDVLILFGTIAVWVWLMDAKEDWSVVTLQVWLYLVFLGRS
jgi:hypothetical protein